jgi:hypothetical protein
LHGIHGSFRFPLRRFKTQDGQETDFLSLSGSVDNGVSYRLAEEVCYLANRISYAEVHDIVAHRRGIDISAMTVHRIVQQAAQDAERVVAQSLSDTANRPMPLLADKVDVYDPDSAEVIVMEDGILAKAQKPQRRPDCQRPTRFIATNMACMLLPDGRYHRVSESIERNKVGSFTVSEALRAAVIQHWSGRSEDLRVVALTDGASCIRKHLTEVFGEHATIILDWYHMTKKLQVLLSQICWGNKHRKAVQYEMTGLLWEGKVEEALKVLQGLKPRKADKAKELEEYLTKHQHEIIDYERRQKSGKTIGSGRMEKVVDQAVALRQKRKGMSWTEAGSRALAHLRTVELNGQWHDFWEAKAA